VIAAAPPPRDHRPSGTVTFLMTDIERSAIHALTRGRDRAKIDRVSGSLMHSGRGVSMAKTIFYANSVSGVSDFSASRDRFLADGPDRVTHCAYAVSAISQTTKPRPVIEKRAR
jgi:hypothetical protein